MRRAALLVLALAAAACGTDDGRPVATPATTTIMTPTSTTVTTTTTSTSTTTVTTSATTTSTTAAPAPLEERLDQLGYWPGVVDDVLDENTAHAVTAVQKVAGLPRTGVVDPATEQAIAAGVLPTPISTTGRSVEIDLERQVLVIVVDGSVVAVFDTSTGRRPGSTPRGEFAVTREIDGYRRSALGLLYRPKYFVRGVAVHGYTSVPPQPASHGCVRVTYPAMDHIWSAGLAPLGTRVIVH